MTREQLKEYDNDLHSAITDEMRIVVVRDWNQTSACYEVWVNFREELYRVLGGEERYYVHHVLSDEVVTESVDNAADAVQLIIGDESNRGESRNE